LGLANALLVSLDNAIKRYQLYFHNWEARLAEAQLDGILVAANAWLAGNNTPPDRWHPIDRYRYFAARDVVAGVRDEAQAHLTFWTHDPAPPPGLVRQYRTTRGATAGAWGERHPLAGGGTERYASILEIVTKPYEPETHTGKTGIVNAIAEADQLAAAIEAATGNFASRARLNAIANTNVTNPETFVGSDLPTRNQQSTDASIQSTFAIDLSQLPSLVLSTIAGGAPQRRFQVKHQADEPDPMGPGLVLRAQVEMTKAVANATTVINDLKLQVGVGAPSFVNLRGLVTLVCQYLRMGRYWDPGGVQPLDKNLTDLLSRTDLAQIFRDAVPATEKTWTAAHLDRVVDRILVATQRTGHKALFNNPTEIRALGASGAFAVSCREFVRRVFTSADDGVTRHLGGFQRRPVEDVDPTGARRAGEAQSGAFGHRQAPVFELRNMIPKLDVLQAIAGGNQERFPRSEWVTLVTYMADLVDMLNARTEAAATTDVKIAEGGGAGARQTRPLHAPW
jgi:hypothetical protein